MKIVMGGSFVENFYRLKVMKSLVVLFIQFGLMVPQFSSAQLAQKADTVGFEIGPDKRIYVQAYVNGNLKRPFRFLVDTGASGIVLNAAVPEVMGNASFTSRVLNQGPTSTEEIPATAPVQKLQIGHSEVTGLRFTAISYPPQAWDGVLGLAYLKCFDVVFNYDRKELYLYAHGTAPRGAGSGIDFVYRADVPVIPVTVTIKGKEHRLMVELDSGSDRVLDINTPYVEAHRLRGTLPVFAVSTIMGTGTAQGRLENVCFDSAKVGDVCFPLLPGAFSTLTSGLQSTATFDGVIGNNLLQRFNQQWDFVRNKLYLTVNHRYYSPFYDFLIVR